MCCMLAGHAERHDIWHKTSVMGAHQTGMRWPHHSCRETHQSRMLLSHMLYTFSKRSGTIRMSPSATACSPLLKDPPSDPRLTTVPGSCVVGMWICKASAVRQCVKSSDTNRTNAFQHL